MKVIIAVVALMLIGVIALLSLSAGPAVKIDSGTKIIGVSTPVRIEVESPHGIKRVTAYLEQGGTRYPLMEKSEPSHHVFWRKNQQAQTLTFEAGKNKAPNLKEGDARVLVKCSRCKTEFVEDFAQLVRA